MQSPSNTTQALLAVLLVVGILFAAYYVLTMPDRRTTSERVNDAASELSNGVRDAGRQLQDRTPADRINDAVKDIRNGNK